MNVPNKTQNIWSSYIFFIKFIIVWRLFSRKASNHVALIIFPFNKNPWGEYKKQMKISSSNFNWEIDWNFQISNSSVKVDGLMEIKN